MYTIKFEYEASPEFAHAYLVNAGLIQSECDDVAIQGTVYLAVDLSDGHMEIEDAELAGFSNGRQIEIDLDVKLEYDIMNQVEQNSTKVYQDAQSIAADYAESMYDSFYDR